MVVMHDAGDRVDRVRGQVLHVVELGELAAVVRDVEVLELLQRLPAEVRPVDQEQDALGAGRGGSAGTRCSRP